MGEYRFKVHGSGLARGTAPSTDSERKLCANEELGMKVAASPRSRAQVAAVLAFIISHTTFLAAQDDETGRCPKAGG